MMLKTFMKEEKKLLKGLKIEYFHFIVMKFMNKWKHQQKQQKKKKKKKERKNQKKKKKKKIENHLIQMKLLNG